MFCWITEKSKQKFKYLENKKSFWGEIKSIFHHFSKDFKCPKIASDVRMLLQYFLVFNTHYLRNLHRAIRSSIYNVGTSMKTLLCFFDFEMSVVHCSWTKDDQSVFQKFSGKEHVSATVFFIICSNYHGTAW